MERLTDELINVQYETLMSCKLITLTRDAALQLLDEIICRRAEEKMEVDKIQGGDSDEQNKISTP